jgi:hypothetical protein
MKKSYTLSIAYFTFTKSKPAYLAEVSFLTVTASYALSLLLLFEVCLDAEAYYPSRLVKILAAVRHIFLIFLS